MLYIIATPIGNLSDITLRALEVLKEVDIIACEDTRHTKILLDRYSIQKPMVSYHQHSKIQKIEFLIDALKHEKNIALLSDAGTPGISDPGNKLVELATTEGIQVVPIPGPSALIAALSVSGFPTDHFTFYGFLPHKKGRQTIFRTISESPIVSVFFESTHRIIKTLEQMKDFLGDERKIFVAREMTKKFETLYRGNVMEVLEKLKTDSTKGEFVVVVR